jgi:hypothetical protein
MKYWAFLSYSHTDKKWGDWLHKALETMPCSVESILPFLQACRPLILGQSGEQIVNHSCSLESVNPKSFFPEGRTKHNQAAYDFAEGVLTRGVSGAQSP